MSASFEEKSVWVQLVGMVVGLGWYFVVAGVMMWNGARVLPAFAPVFAVAVVLLVILMIVGHAVAAVMSRPEPRDERDRIIGWRAESRASWLLAAGVVTAIFGMIVGVENVWTAHLLLAALFLSETVGLSVRLVYYRRGVR